MATRLLWGVAVAAGLLLAVGMTLVDNTGDPLAETPVLIANRTIEAGTPGTIIATREMYTATTLPKQEVAERALADPAYLAGRAVTAEILPGEQLTGDSFRP